MSVWGELRRRNVVKVGVAYAILAWLLIQIASILLPTFDAPLWVMRVIVLMLGIGFVVSVFVAWAYELTPEGIKPTQEVPRADSIRPTTGRKLNYVVSGLLAVAVVALLVDNYLLNDTRQGHIPTPAGTAPEAELAEMADSILQNSVAVLPFANLSPNTEDAYFAAGIHDEILNQLGKIGNLSVISRTSVLRYQNTDLSIPDIARELNVGTIMEGTVRYAGDRVRVTTQLIDAQTDQHLWTETYERAFQDIFAIESDIAMNVANALRAEFSLQEQRRIERIPTESSEAYALYLEARSLPSGMELERTLGLLQEAVGIDPEFALAHANIAFLLAQSMINSNFSDAATSSEAEARVLEHVNRALAIDPELPDAYNALGLLHQNFWRWDEARAAFAQSEALAPGNDGMLLGYSFFLAFARERADALRLAERRIELQPNVLFALVSLSVVQAHAGDPEAALASANAVLAAQPNNLLARLGAALNAVRLGDLEEGEAHLRLVERLMGENRVLIYVAQIAIPYSLLGLEDEVARLLAEVEEMRRGVETSAGLDAMIALASGDRAATLAALESAVAKVERQELDTSFYELMTIKNNVFGHPMLDEPAFQELRNQLGTL